MLTALINKAEAIVLAQSFVRNLKKKYNINCCYSLLQINYGIEITIIDNALVS